MNTLHSYLQLQIRITKKKKKSKFIWNINTRLSPNSMSSFHSMDVSIKDVRLLFYPPSHTSKQEENRNTAHLYLEDIR